MEGKVLVAYATKYGSTQETAERIAADLRGYGLDVDVQAMKNVKSLDGYRGAVLGAPLYIGSWHKDAQNFLSRFQADLVKMTLAFFTLGPTRESTEAEWKEIQASVDTNMAKFPWLKPVQSALWGGVYNPDKLRFPDTLIKIMPASPLKDMPASDLRDWAVIKAWSEDMAEKL